MGDRRPFSFRFWSSATPSRRTTATQTTAPPPPATTTSAPNTAPRAESQAVSQSTASTTKPASMTPPMAETQTQGSQSTTTSGSTPKPTTLSTTEGPTADQQNTSAPGPITTPATEVQTASKPTITTLTSSTYEPKTSTTFTSSTDEPKTSSPSRAATQSPSSSQPTSSSYQTAQSRSPPKPSSPSRAASQARSMPSSPSRMGSQTPSTPQKASKPHSPSRLPSLSSEQTSSTISKEPRRTTQEISSSYEAPTSGSNEKGPRPAASQQEPQLKAEVISDSANDFNGQTVDGTSFKHDKMEVMPSKSSELGTNTTSAQGPKTPTTIQKLDSSAINGGHEPLIELNAKSEETNDVKEVGQTTSNEANEEAKKEVNDLVTPKSGSEAQIIEKAEIPSKRDQMHTEEQEAIAIKEIFPTSLPSVKPTNTTISQPKKRSTISDTHNKSAQPIGEQVPFHKDIRDDISTFVNRMAIGDPKSTIYDRPVSVITLAGENRGASMQMGSNSSKREGPVHIHRSYKINPDESAEATTDGEGSSKGKNSEDGKATEDQPTEAYVNNNAQGINNSIVFNGSITERNPGVHMVFTDVPKEPTQSTDKTSPLETRKSEFNMTRIEKLTYEPTVRRRCLRGLFLETSDSDPENPEKPRRHGCRVGCWKGDKENDIDVL